MWAVAVTISQRKCTHMEKCRSRRKQASKPSGAKSDISTLREKEEKTVDILGNGGQSVSQVFEEKAKELVPDKTKRLHRRLARDAILSLSLSLSLFSLLQDCQSLAELLNCTENTKSLDMLSIQHFNICRLALLFQANFCRTDE
jgi:hypothetical protein